MEFSQFHLDVVAHSSYVHTRYTQSFRLTPEIELNVLLMAAMFRDIIFDKKKRREEEYVRWRASAADNVFFVFFRFIVLFNPFGQAKSILHKL